MKQALFLRLLVVERSGTAKTEEIERASVVQCPLGRLMQGKRRVHREGLQQMWSWLLHPRQLSIAVP